MGTSLNRGPCGRSPETPSPRTCGPLGRNDAGDPWHQLLVGDTAGSLGLNDHAALLIADPLPRGRPRQECQAVESGHTDGRYEVSHELAYAWFKLILAGQKTTISEDDRNYYRSCCADIQVLANAGDQFGVLSALPQEVGNALMSPENVPGNVVGGLNVVDSLQARPVVTAAEADHLLDAVRLGKKVGIDLAGGGRLQIYDANKFLKKAARGKERKLYPPKYKVKLTGVPLVEVSGATIGKDGIVRAAASSETVRELAKGPTLDRWSQTKSVRRLANSNLFGLVLAVGPQAVSDFSKAKDWRQFVSLSAKSQSGNLAGFAASVIAVGAAATIVTMTAPMVLGVGMVAGIAAQVAFNASGADDFAQEKVDSLLK